MPLCTDIFFSCKSFCLCLFRITIWNFRGFWVLTRDFRAEMHKNVTSRNDVSLIFLHVVRCHDNSLLI